MAGIMERAAARLQHFILPNIEATNADRILRRTGIVTETVDNLHARGQVRIDGMLWSARSGSDAVIQEGRQVYVLRIEGVRAIVDEVVPEIG